MSPKISFIFLSQVDSSLSQERKDGFFFFFWFFGPLIAHPLWHLMDLKKWLKPTFEPGWFCLVSHFPRKKERKKESVLKLQTKGPTMFGVCCGSFELSFQEGEMVSLAGYKRHLDGWAGLS
jgi:hypothetical protein